MFMLDLKSLRNFTSSEAKRVRGSQSACTRDARRVRSRKSPSSRTIALNCMSYRVLAPGGAREPGASHFCRPTALLWLKNTPEDFSHCGQRKFRCRSSLLPSSPTLTFLARVFAVSGPSWTRSRRGRVRGAGPVSAVTFTGWRTAALRLSAPRAASARRTRLPLRAFHNKTQTSIMSASLMKTISWLLIHPIFLLHVKWNIKAFCVVILMISAWGVAVKFSKIFSVFIDIFNLSSCAAVQLFADVFAGHFHVLFFWDVVHFTLFCHL